MNQSEWLASDDPAVMLEWVTDYPRSSGTGVRISPPIPSERKLRLFACAVARAAPHTLEAYPLRCLAVAERRADGEAVKTVMYEAERKYASGSTGVLSRDRVALACCHTLPQTAVVGALREHSMLYPDQAVARRVQAALLREVVGDPFRATFTLAKVPAKWGGRLTPTVLSLARTAYGERDFGLLPILADALEDAGCDDDAILSHLRSPGPHARGCWALDLMLGRQ